MSALLEKLDGGLLAVDIDRYGKLDFTLTERGFDKESGK